MISLAGRTSTRRLDGRLFLRHARIVRGGCAKRQAGFPSEALRKEVAHFETNATSAAERAT
jgi:hypothetical protein